MRGLRQIALWIFVSSLGGDVKARPIVLTLARCFIGLPECGDERTDAHLFQSTAGQESVVGLNHELERSRTDRND